MAMTQAVLSSTLDVGALDAVESRLAACEPERGRAHAGVLRDALELAGLYGDAGMWDAVPCQLALLLRSSEARATSLLTTGQVLVELPGAFGLLETGVLTVEQSAAVGRVLDPLPPEVRDAVWDRAVVRLRADVDRGRVCPPARLTELLRTWAAEIDPDAAVQRRRTAEAGGGVLLHRRDDGLCDVLLSGLTLPLADAVLSRVTIAAQAGAFVGDERTAGKRRLDAAVDLLLGRTGRPAGECAPAGGEAPSEAQGCAGGCGCSLGASVPCGAQVTVLVPSATALGVGDVPAQQAGHGPLEPDLVAALLGSAPVLRAVWVDPDGNPVTAPSRPERPARGDAESVRQALRRLVAADPGERMPRHPDDHAPPPDSEPPPDDSPPGDPPDDVPRHDDPPPDDQLDHHSPAVDLLPVARAPRRPRLRVRPHPPGTPGPYRVPARLSRFLAVRAPRCEWPGCGARAARCDDEHDLAHPHGPTCACNLGPCCRRHHRVKQLGWTKQRTPDGVLWTSPTLRTWLSAPQTLDVPRLRTHRRAAGSTLRTLSPGELQDALHPADPWFDGRDTTDGGWVLAEARAEQRWWTRELRELRRGRGPHAA